MAWIFPESRKQYWQPGTRGVESRLHQSREQGEFNNTYNRRFMKEEVPYSGFESYFYNTAQDAGEMNGDFDADGHILKEECSVDFDSSAREEAQLNIFDNSQRNIQKLFREIQDKIQLFFE